MSEEQKDQLGNETTETDDSAKRTTKANQDKKDFGSLVKAKYYEYSAEFKKIIWPSRRQLVKQTFTVVVISLMFGLLIFGMDTGYRLGSNYLISLIQ